MLVAETDSVAVAVTVVKSVVTEERDGTKRVGEENAEDTGTVAVENSEDTSKENDQSVVIKTGSSRLTDVHNKQGWRNDKGSERKGRRIEKGQDKPGENEKREG